MNNTVYYFKSTSIEDCRKVWSMFRVILRANFGSNGSSSISARDKYNLVNLSITSLNIVGYRGVIDAVDSSLSLFVSSSISASATSTGFSSLYSFAVCSTVNSWDNSLFYMPMWISQSASKSSKVLTLDWLHGVD